MPSAIALVSAVPLLNPRWEKTCTKPETAPIRPSNGAMPVMISSTMRPRSRMTISWRARVSTDSTFSERGARRCCRATRVMRASAESSSRTMRASRSGFPPGASRSISLSITSGKTFFRRNAIVRRMMTVRATIEQIRSGHMKRPPRMRNATADCNGLVASARRKVIGLRKS